MVFYICISFAQKPLEKKPLINVLEQIETIHNFTFSYQVETLKNHTVRGDIPQSKNKILSFLERETLFNFQILKDNSVAIKLKPEVKLICVQPFNIVTQDPIQNFKITTKYQELRGNNISKINIYSLSNNEVIFIESEGMESIETTVSKNVTNDCNAIYLISKIEVLEPILINSYLTRGIQKKQNGVITINYNKFDILPGLIEPDVLQTLQALPGVQSVNETVSYLNIRGGTNDQNLILWDGIKMYQSGHFFGLISAFNPYLTKQASLIKNGSDAQYGDGVSGIIAMESDHTNATNYKAGAGINMLSADLYAVVPFTKKGAIEFSARKSINDYFKTPTYQEYFDKIFQNTELTTNSDLKSTSNDDFDFFDTSLKINYSLSEKDNIRVNFLLIDNSLGFLETATINNSSLSRESMLSQNNISGGIYHQRNWNSSTVTQTQLYGSKYSLDATNFDILNNQRLLQKNEVIESGIKTMTRFKVLEKVSATAGYQFNETGITNFEQINNPFFQRTDTQVLRINSLFTQVYYTSKNNKINASIGIRANQISKFNDILIEPRLSINHQFLKNFQVEILGEIKNQTTSQVIDFQNDFLGVENRKWVLSNPDEIPIIKGKQLSLGLSYSKNKLLVTVEPYLKKIDGISTQSQGFQNQLQNIKESGSYFVRGVDVLVNKQIKNINTWLSYTYAKNTYNFNSVTPSVFHNNLDIRHSFTYGINYSWNNFKLSGGVNWHSGKPTTNLVEGNEISTNSLNFEEPNTSSLKDYLRVDASALYDFKLSKKLKARVGLSVWNILNRTNNFNRFFRLNDGNTIEEVNERALRFTPNFTFRVNF